MIEYITERNDRVAYIYYMLEEIKTRAFIQKFIEQLGITSRSTAERIIKKLDMNKQLFLAAYTPEKNDREAVEAILDVKEEPVLKDGDIIEHNGKRYKFVYTGYTGLDECDNCCLNCGNEYCICENKIDLESVPGYFIEDTETIALDETGRDEKSEEIRLLKLELHKYRVLYDRQKLECLLHDSVNSIELNPKYDSLYKVLLAAYNQASCGKGKERHQLNNEEPFENQKICEIARRLSVDYNLGQAVKKIYESKRLTEGRDIAELYGAINYIAAAIIVKKEEKNE